MDIPAEMLAPKVRREAVGEGFSFDGTKLADAAPHEQNLVTNYTLAYFDGFG